jgi:RNA polymerase primary sigma factor
LRDVDSGASPIKRMGALLKLAIVSGAQDSLRLQIARGADINATDDKGRSPLILAAARGHLAMCSALLDAGAQRDTRDFSGLDAFEYARAAGHEHVAALLATPEPLPEEASEIPDDSSSGNPALDEFGSWEAEEEPTEPENQVFAIEAASRVQQDIAFHEPIDNYLDWDDIDVDLPESARRRRGDLGEFELADIRRLFEQGIDERRVILGPLLERIYGEDERSSREMRSRLETICGDLGIVIEDDASYTGLHPYGGSPNFDESAVDEAINFLESLGSRHTDPLFQFYREMGRHPLLTREEEQEIGREMELTEEQAVRAFAAHPVAVVSLLDVLGSVESGSRSLGSVIDTDPSVPASVEEPDVEDSSELLPDLGSADEDQTKEPDSLPAFLSRAKEIRMLHATSPGDGATTTQIAAIMAAMHLRWSLVAKLGTAACMGHPHLTESISLATAMRAARVAQERLFRSNLRLVYSTARKYSFRALPLADIVQEGCIGLMKAVEKFQYRLGHKFSTYAMWWVKQAITRALADQERLVRLPVHMVESVNALNRHIRDHERRTGVVPTSSELAELMSIDKSKVEKLKQVQRTVVSLDDAEDGPSITKHLVDTAPTLDDVVEHSSLHEVVQNLVNSLDSRTARVLSLRFGLADDHDMTLEEVGSEFGVTRERIRQIEAKGLRKLRHPSRSKLLDGYLPDRARLERSSAESPEKGDSDDVSASEKATPTPRPSGKKIGADDSVSSEAWAEIAITLAELHRLTAHDFRPAGEGVFIEFDPEKVNVSQQVRKELQRLGFTYSTVDRGFWRA